MDWPKSIIDRADCFDVHFMEVEIRSAIVGVLCGIFLAGVVSVENIIIIDYKQCSFLGN